ncbi:hypothetical protein V6N13_038895 [Hibiscus sabdariffa]
MAVLSTDDDSRSGGGDERFKGLVVTFMLSSDLNSRQGKRKALVKKTNKMHIEKENILSRLRRGIFKIFDSKG